MKENRKHYHIDLTKSELNFEQAVKWLIVNGFVFSSCRFVTMQDIRRVWHTCDSWRYLMFNLSSTCSRVIDGGVSRGISDDSIEVTVEEVLKLDL